ncbi:MATE family efflux transporter [Butyricicoccus sp.]|uniref:MATE family efflux transporter n=1 Tax=Butyricicoccus sp. TaxID=2049021 RepID=UPI003F18A746
MQKENKMGVMPVPRLVLSMAVPIMISMVVQSMYNIVDSIFVARINEQALTATSLAYSAQMLQIAVAVGTGVGVNALVSRRLGAKEYQEANEAATTGLILTVLSSLIFVVWGICGSRSFIALFSDDPEILDYGTTYLQICQTYATGIFLATFFQRILQATGRTVSSMFAQLAGAVVNLILDPIMIFGYFGCPAMGIAGAAIATVIGQWTSALCGILLQFIQNKELRFVWKGFRMKAANVLTIYQVGIPTIVTQAFGSIMIALMNMVLIVFSPTAVAFFGVYFKLQNFLFMPLNGMGQASLPIVGYNYGADKLDRVGQTYRTTIKYGLAIACIGAVIFMAVPGVLLDAFSASEVMKEMGIPALRIICISFLPASVTMMIGYTVSGLGNGMVNMISTAIRQCIVLIPIVLLFGTLGGINTIWFAFWISETCALLFAGFQLRRNMKRVRENSRNRSTAA